MIHASGNIDENHLSPLHVRSGYSMLRGPSSIDRMVERAAGLGHRSLALADVNNLCGATMFWKQACKAGIAPIIGAELVDGGASALALVAGDSGYENLCRIISRIQQRQHQGLASAKFGFDDSLPRAAAGAGPHSLLCADIAECADGLEVIVEGSELAEGLLHACARGGMGGHVWLGLDATQEYTQRRAIEAAAHRLGLPTALTGRAMMASAGDMEAARLLAAIRTGGTLAQVGAGELPHRRAHLKDSRELFQEAQIAGLDDAPAAMRGNREIRQRCSAFKLLPRSAVFPNFVSPEGLTAGQHLRQLCNDGLWWRYGVDTPDQAQARLVRELDLIVRMGFCEYFLVVWDIVQYARRRGAPVAGRGSGASSLVAYLLGITNVCPLAFEIPFERFLNEYRTDFPDLDVDFCWRIRDEVIGYAFKRWGWANVAMVSMHTTFQERSALRETAKAMGFSNEQVSGSDFAPQEMRKYEPASSRPSVPQHEVSRMAAKIFGLPHVLSVHPGGIVIGRKPIDHYVPVQPAAKGVMISQMDKNALEDMRLVKLDLLGNRNLSTIRYATNLIRRRHGVSVDIESLGYDQATMQMLQQARTVGCNQLESPAMRHLLSMMQPRDVRDVMKALALIRPGAASIGMKELFIRRHRGLEGLGMFELAGTGQPASSGGRAASGQPSPLEQVREILKGSYGVMLYEDDVMLVAAAMMGSSLDTADRFRKAVQKCSDDRQRLELSRQFLEACSGRGVDIEFAKSMWVQMAKYNAYSFCRAHAASYAVLAYAGAYLKAHYALEFWCSALNNNQSMYPTRCYVEQAKRQGIAFLGPDVNRSEEEFSIDDASASGQAGGAIRVGLNRVSGLGPANIEGLLRARANGDFGSLSDCLARTGLGREQARALVLCGAFDWTGRGRPALMLELELFLSTKMGRVWQGQSLLAIGAHMPVVPGDYEPLQKYMQERQILGLSTGPHIMDVYRALLPDGLVMSEEVARHVGRRIRVAGMIEAHRTAMTLHGKELLFLTLEDELGLVEVTLFPGQCRNARVVGPYGPYIVTGKVEDQYGSITLRADNIELVTAEMEQH